VPYYYIVYMVYVNRCEGNLNCLAYVLCLISPSIKFTVRDSPIRSNKVECVRVIPMYISKDKDMCLRLLQIGKIFFVSSGVEGWRFMYDSWV
jgi:hypothetical protein